MTDLISWVVANKVPLINIVGICCDIVGAFYVAYEVVNQFNGSKYKNTTVQNVINNNPEIEIEPPPESPQYRKWEFNKYRYMKFGLSFLVLGFLLQLIANILQIKLTV